MPPPPAFLAPAMSHCNCVKNLDDDCPAGSFPKLPTPTHLQVDDCLETLSSGVVHYDAATDEQHTLSITPGHQVRAFCFQDQPPSPGSPASSPKPEAGLGV